MGISSEAFWLHSGLAVLFQVAAGVFFWKRRPFVAWTLQYGAAHAALLAGVRSERIAAFVVAAALFGVTAWVPGRRLHGGSRWLLIVVLASFGLGALMWSGLMVDAKETRGRPLIGDRWSSASPLRQVGDSVVLKPQWRRGRVRDWGSGVRFDWGVPGGAKDVELLLENAGAADAWIVEEGAATIEGGGRSRLRLRMAFPPRGGSVRLRRREASSAHTALCVVGGLRGDLDAVDALIGALSPRRPDGVVLLGDMIDRGDHLGLLALRDRFDSLGVPVMYVPGPAERGDEDAAGFSALFEGRRSRGRSARLDDVSAILLDTTDDVGLEEALGGLSARRLIGGEAGGVSVVFGHRALIGPDDRREGLIEDDAVRRAITGRLREWSAGLAVGTTPGAKYDVERDGLRQLALGVRDDAVDAAVLEIAATGECSVRWLEIPRDGADGVSGRVARWVAGAEENIPLTEWATLGAGAMLGALLMLAVRGRVEGR